MRSIFNTALSTTTLFFAVGGIGFVQAQAQEQPTAAKTQRNAVLAPIEDVVGLPRVLLIGDSISMGYTLPVREKLAGKANVHRPAANCGPTTTGLASIDNWLGDGKWDLIHFNWGLHDLKFVGPQGENLAAVDDPQNHRQVTPQEYEKNLRQLVARLKQTGAILIWRNTTPVPEGSAGRIAEDAEKYNEIAGRVMQENGIEVHDLYAFVQPQMTALMLPKANVHFTPVGYDALAAEVANVIAQHLEVK